MNNMNFTPRTGISATEKSNKGWINILLTDDNGKSIQICGTQVDSSSKFLNKEGKAIHKQMEELLDDMENGEVLILEYPLHIEIRKTDPDASTEVSVNLRNAIRKK